MALPLEGIRVLELGHIIAGPAAGLILADLGADVIKVEAPVIHDETRLSIATRGDFYLFNRNKRSIVLDLKMSTGKETFLELARASDVLIENMAPETITRLGLHYENLEPINPRLIYCSVKGFQTGPNQDRPFLDELAQMMGGLAYMTGPAGRPLRAGASVIDIGAGTYAAMGVLLALRERDSTGKGQKVTSGLFETAMFWVGHHMSQAIMTDRCPPPMPSKERMWAIYDLFTCADGKQVFVGVTSDAQWPRFCDSVGLSGLLRNPRLTTNARRQRERSWLIPNVRAKLASIDSGELIRRLVDASIPVAIVNSPEDLFQDPHVNFGNHLLKTQMGDKSGRLPSLPFESSSYRFEIRQQPPQRPGSHSQEILIEAGYSKEKIESLLQTGAVMAN
jgi:crotonobetainyl-CoA:carnitine CoA-transferase CaiB-like acyl-CoA transferase